jgi:hypothetical protein
MLVAASSPQPNDVILDPFAGSGALLAARADYPFKRLIYNDLSLDQHRPRLDPRLKGEKVIALAEDAFSLRSVTPGGVDVIITDPPWGEYEEFDTPIDQWAKEFAHLLVQMLHRENGRYVVLINRRNGQGLAAALKDAGLPASRSIDVLVNGHPATILIRTPVSR